MKFLRSFLDSLLAIQISIHARKQKTPIKSGPEYFFIQ